MGCRILEDNMGMACFYDSVTDFAFGPVATREELEQFTKWLKEDPRGVIDIKYEWEEFNKTENGTNTTE